MSEHVFTRQMWCERCAKAGRPYSGLKFIVSAYKLIGDSDIAISRVCGIVGCGLILEPDPTDINKLIFTYRKVSYDQIRLIDWNTLVESKDLGYKL